MVTVRQIVMSDRFKQRPKSNLGRTNSQMVYTSFLHNGEPWRRTDVAWGTNSISSRPLSTNLGISGAKIGARHWTVNIGPDAGGFLPVLNVKCRAETAHGRSRDKPLLSNNNTKSSSDHLNTDKKTQGDIITGANGKGTGTASMFDLTSLMPPPPNADAFINGLTTHLEKIPRPPLSTRNTPQSTRESWSPSPEFKIASPDNEEKCRLISSTKSENKDTSCKPDISKKSKNLDITLPSPSLSSERPLLNVAKSPETDDVKFEDLPSLQSKLKPILKMGPENDNATPTGKRPLSQTRFTIPLAPPASSSSPRKVNRRGKTVHRSKRPVRDEMHESENCSKDDEPQSSQGSIENLQSTEQLATGKSVRFCSHADQVKEYLPWEAPNSSLINGDFSNSLPTMDFSKFYEPFSILDKKLKH